MQTLQWLSRTFRKKVDIGNRRALSVTRMSPSELTGGLERQLYGMSMHEQSIVKQVPAMSGETVIVRQNTFALDKKNNPCHLEEGRQVRISENPLTLDRQGDVRINILDESDKPLSMRLSDYIEDICANH